MGIDKSQTFYSSNYFDMTDLYLGNDMPVIAVALLIALAGSIVIYSIFYISVMGKRKEYGRLKVIGATPHQLKRVVKRERRILTLIGIPTGLAAAALISNLLMPGFWVWSRNIKYAAAAAAVTWLVVLLATRKPLKLVGKVSAIEAVRSTAYSEQLKRTAFGHRYRRLTIFRLAAMNFSRNRRKAVMTLVSLGLTGIMVISASAYAGSVDAMEMAKAQFGDQSDYLLEYEGNMGEAFYENQKQYLLDHTMQSRLMLLPGVEYITTYSAVNVTVPDIATEDAFFIRGLTREQMSAQLTDKSVREGTADYQELLDNDGILVVRTVDNLMSKLYDVSYAVGDTITMNCFNGQTRTYTVMGIVDDISVVSSTHFFILPEEELHSLYPEIEDFTAYINIHAAKNSDRLRQSVFEAVVTPEVHISAVEDLALLMETSLQGQMKILNGILLFLFLFALLNLANTLITGLLSRCQEFGVLQVAGMSNRQLSRMLAYECLLYMGITMLITLTVGTACSMALCSIFRTLGLFGDITYHFPALPMLVFGMALLMVQAVFTVVAVRFTGKLTLVERIKEIE